jgi:protein-S-isoprenylcysteine O-methyltransferase Ste14
MDKKRILGIPVLGLFLSSGFLFIVPETLLTYPTGVVVLLFEVFIIIDVVTRPVSSKQDRYRRSRPFTISLFLLLPILLIIPVFEYTALWKQYLTPFESELLAIFGLLILLFGGSTLLLSRRLIGRYGGTRIAIEDDHRLVTTGPYRYIRHPIYLGMLCLFAGYFIALGSLLVTLVWTMVLFWVLRERMAQEEESTVPI